MISVIRHHWPAIALAILTGLVIALPPFILKFRYGIPFDHPANIRIDDEFLYFARMREVLDGHPLIGNAYLWEHKDKPSIPFFFGEWLLAQPIRFAGAGVVAGNVAYDVVFPAAAALLTYAAIFLLSRSRWVSLLGAAFLFFGLFSGEFGRAWSPQFVFLFWLTQFLVLLLLVRDFDQPRRRRRWVLLGAINFGLNVYLYPYTWTFYLILLGILGAAWFLAGRRREAAAMAAVAGGGLLLGVPYFWLVARALALPEYAETLYRISMIDSRFPSGIAIVLPGFGILAAGLAALRFGLIALDRRTLFLASGMAAAMVVVNQHLLTGRNFEFSSHYFMPAAFWFVFSGAYLLRALRDRLPAFGRQQLGAAVAVFAIGLAALNLRDAGAGFSPPEEPGLGRYRPVLDRIAREIEPDAVVWAGPELSQLIPIYTGASVYFAPPVRTFVLSDEEVMDRFITSAFFDPLDREAVAGSFRIIFGNRYLNPALHAGQENRLRALFGLPLKPLDPMPEAAIDRVLERARALRASGFESALKRYRADYVVWDREAHPLAEFDRMPFLAKSGEIDAFAIYHVR